MVGPPGAYQFALVCSVGTGLNAGHLDPTRAALLVLAGWPNRAAAECWRLEQLPPENDSPTTAFNDIQLALSELADAVRSGRNPPPITMSTSPLATEVQNVRDTLLH